MHATTPASGFHMSDVRAKQATARRAVAIIFPSATTAPTGGVDALGRRRVISSRTAGSAIARTCGARALSSSTVSFWISRIS